MPAKKEINRNDIIEKIFEINNLDKQYSTFQLTSRKYIRVAKFFNIHDLLKQINECPDVKFILDNGYSINAQSLRYKTFYKNDTCVNCGLKGKFLALEMILPPSLKLPYNKKGFHLNLYAINEKGEEVLMTKDHIYPKAKGGRDVLSNMQTMCCHCNFDKADNIE